MHLWNAVARPASTGRRLANCTVKPRDIGVNAMLAVLKGQSSYWPHIAVVDPTLRQRSHTKRAMVLRVLSASKPHALTRSNRCYRVVIKAHRPTVVHRAEGKSVARSPADNRAVAPPSVRASSGLRASSNVDNCSLEHSPSSPSP